MKNFNAEMIEKAKTVKSAEELLELAKANGMEITADEAKTYFAQLNPKSGELDDDDLDAVAGGTDKNKEGYVKVDKNDECLCGEYESSPTPIHSNTKDGRHCGTCKHCRQVRSADICTKMKF